MFYWKYSSNRIFIFNEYWIFIPLAVLANYVITQKILSGKKKRQELKALKDQLKDQLEREKKIRQILLLSIGLNGYAATYIAMRGGADLIDVDYITCNIQKGVRYLCTSFRTKSLNLCPSSTTRSPYLYGK